MQIFFLFEKLAPRFWELAWGLTRLGEARIISQKLSCHSNTPGSPSWRRSRQAKQGRTQDVGVMERWALFRIDNTTTSAVPYGMVFRLIRSVAQHLRAYDMFCWAKRPWRRPMRRGPDWCGIKGRLEPWMMTIDMGPKGIDSCGGRLGGFHDCSP